MLNSPIDKEHLRLMLPHAGQMCLLERVLRYQETEIECTAISHQDLTNPLRFNDVLPSHAGIEYCAQAVAIHGYLTSKEANSHPKRGYLAVILSAEWRVERLDRCNGDLHITATKQVTLSQGVSYGFAIRFEGHELLVGQAIVALDQ